MSRRIWLTSIFLLLILTGGLLYLVSHLQQHPASPVSPPLCPTSSSHGAPNMNQPTCNQQRILIFSKTAGYRHDSIPAATAALKTLASEHNIQADSTEDASMFTPQNLAHYNVVIFLMTSGHILDTDQQQAFEHYIHAGGGYVGLRSHANNLFVSTDLNLAAKSLRAGWATTIGGWEKFHFEPVGNGSYGIRAAANGLYVTADMKLANAPLEAQWATSVGRWERFQCIPQ